MPVYQYRKVGTSQVVELFRLISQRDSVPPGLLRITVPVRIGVLGTSSDPVDEDSAEYQVPRAWKQVEEKMSAKEALKESGFTVDQVRQTWGM